MDWKGHFFASGRAIKNRRQGLDIERRPKNLKKSPNRFKNELVRAKREIFSNICGLLEISEL